MVVLFTFHACKVCVGELGEEGGGKGNSYVFSKTGRLLQKLVAEGRLE